MTTVQRNYIIFEGNASKKSKIKMENEKIFMEAVDEGLSMLGESAKQSTYFYIEKIYGIRRKDIPFMIEEFAE